MYRPSSHIEAYGSLESTGWLFVMSGCIPPLAGPIPLQWTDTGGQIGVIHHLDFCLPNALDREVQRGSSPANAAINLPESRIPPRTPRCPGGVGWC
jgi:hypothetical protein